MDKHERRKSIDSSILEGKLGCLSLKVKGIGELLLSSRTDRDLSERGLEGIGVLLSEISEDLFDLSQTQIQRTQPPNSGGRL